jgi:hypothetical protein
VESNETQSDRPNDNAFRDLYSWLRALATVMIAERVVLGMEVSREAGAYLLANAQTVRAYLDSLQDDGHADSTDLLEASCGDEPSLGPVA